MAAKTLQGTVTSDKMNKTVTVVVAEERSIRNMANTLIYQLNITCMMKKKLQKKEILFLFRSASQFPSQKLGVS